VFIAAGDLVLNDLSDVPDFGLLTAMTMSPARLPFMGLQHHRHVT
jgi:hypothetical protein